MRYLLLGFSSSLLSISVINSYYTMGVVAIILMALSSALINNQKKEDEQ